MYYYMKILIIYIMQTCLHGIKIYYTKIYM